MNVEEVKQQLIEHEGLELTAYQCPAGRWTIGVGRNVQDKGISREEAMMLLENDINECIADLQQIFPDFDDLAEPRQRALVDMRFNLGPQRFRGFQNMIAAVKGSDFARAADEMIDSRWYTQVGPRGERLVGMMREG
jgi:lysozyme